MRWNGNKLRQVREGLGVTQDTLATLVGVPKRDIVRWEGGIGRDEPRGSKVVEIKVALTMRAIDCGQPAVTDSDLYE